MLKNLKTKQEKNCERILLSLCSFIFFLCVFFPGKAKAKALGGVEKGERELYCCVFYETIFPL